VNNLRRVGRKRGELNSETNRIEKRLAELFEAKGFGVIGNLQPPRDGLDEVGEIDLICFRDGHLFIFEIKSGYIRKSQRDAWHHRVNTLRKAGLQLKRKSAYIINNLQLDPKLTALIKDHTLDQIQTHCWIVDTSLEHDHEFFEGFLKVSMQEVIIALRNERHLLRDLHQAIAKEKKARNYEKSNANDLGGICAEAMASICKQNASDNLFPNGLSADQFATVIERDLVWEVLN
jgi:Nuclease-related domain